MKICTHFFLPTVLCERKTSELWLAQSAEEALIKLDCTIGTLFSISVGLAVNIILIARTKQSLHLACSPPKFQVIMHIIIMVVPDGLGYLQELQRWTRGNWSYDSRKWVNKKPQTTIYGLVALSTSRWCCRQLLGGWGEAAQTSDLLRHKASSYAFLLSVPPWTPSFPMTITNAGVHKETKQKWKELKGKKK